MSRKTKRQEVEVLEKQSNLLRPMPTMEWVVTDPDVIDDYYDLAERVGFETAELVRDRLGKFLNENNIGIFHYDEVCEWLTEKRKEAGKLSWCWRPLRKEDKPKFEWRESMERDESSGDWYIPDDHYVKGYCKTYRNLVPRHALELVEKIESVFKGKVCFFVSDYVVPIPDPFLMVRPRKKNDGDNFDYHFVIAVWDEPGFKG